MASATQSTRPFQLMVKPGGSACNLSCAYCYYLEKSALYPSGDSRMDLATLERITEAYLGANPASEVVFGWQGGEPLLMGVGFYRAALQLQARYARPGQRISNAIQTNATLVNHEWAAFFAEHGFLVGVSIDGPPEMHDRYRRDGAGGASHARVVAGLEILQRHGVEVNALATVNRASMVHPQKVYNHLKGLGLEHIQFIPVVEWMPRAQGKVTPPSVEPAHYGRFLCAVFDEWARKDVGRIFVQTFESALSQWLGGPASVCVHAPTCGRNLVAEHNGDLYACDHFVYPEHFRGQIEPATLAALVDSHEQRAFGQTKAALPERCKRCDVRFLCNGDCPKHRPEPTNGQAQVSYLCEAYRRFFKHSGDVLCEMAEEIRAGRPATNVMELLQMLGR